MVQGHLASKGIAFPKTESQSSNACCRSWRHWREKAKAHQEAGVFQPFP
jgi:hypothetical protein